MEGDFVWRDVPVVTHHLHDNGAIGVDGDEGHTAVGHAHTNPAFYWELQCPGMSQPIYPVYNYNHQVNSK